MGDTAWKRIWSADEVATLRHHYQAGVPVADIGAALGRSRASVEKKLSRLGVCDRKGSGGPGTAGSDQSYFEEIDSTVKAYVTGLLCADASLSDRPGGSRSVRYEVKARDRCLLELVKSEFGGEARIVQRPNRDSAYICISGRRVMEGFRVVAEYVRTPGSTKWPISDPDLDRYFILGYSDGDGSVYHGNGSVAWSVVSSNPDFLRLLVDKVREHTAIKFKRIIPCKGKRLWEIRLHGNRKAGAALRWLYGGHSLGLSRKRLRAEAA